MEQEFLPGNLVRARSRTWVVQNGSTNDWLKLRPIGGADDEITELLPALEKEPVTLALFDYPDPTKVGPFCSAELLYDALRFQLRSGAGPFRSFASIAVEPRTYQLLPLLMALRLRVVRLLIADDVGVGKTIEAGLIAREMLDRGEIERIAVLCPPHLVDQWVSELDEHFNIDATALTASSASRLEKQIPHGHTLADVYPVLVVSLDYIKSDKHRDYFLTMKPDLVIVDEAHTCVKGSTRSKQLRFELLQRLAADADRHMLLLTATPHSGNEEGFYNLLSLLDPEFLELRGRTVLARDPLRQKLAQHFVQRRRKDIAEWKVSSNDRLTGFPIRKTTELTYRLTSEWDRFFTDVQDYCREMVEKNRENRLIWFAVLSLFRCISSSPAAAVQALTNHHHLSDVPEETELASEFDDINESTETDVEPAVYLEETDQLTSLVDRARALTGSQSDPKIKLLIGHVRELLKDDFYPVVFCRFVATAHYVYDALKSEFAKEDVTLECITGELVPGERKERVEALSTTKSVFWLPPTVFLRASTCSNTSPRLSTTTLPGIPPDTSSEKVASIVSGKRLLKFAARCSTAQTIRLTASFCKSSFAKALPSEKNSASRCPCLNSKRQSTKPLFAPPSLRNATRPTTSSRSLTCLSLKNCSSSTPSG